MKNPELLKLLDKIREIHEKKSEDYSSQGLYENFERSAQLAEWFSNPIDKSFVILIGTKLARLATLLGRDGIPNNESIEDTFLDLTTYCALWSSYYESHPFAKLAHNHIKRIQEMEAKMTASYEFKEQPPITIP